MDSKTIAIVGGGFSGVAVAYHLLFLAKKNQQLTIDIFDDEDFRNNGKAYQTLDLCHILNVPADKMGLPFDDEENFYKWLNKNYSDKQIGKGDFAPRALYRLYLQEIISEIKKDPRINFINGEVLNIKPNFEISYQENLSTKQKQYSHIVIACGLPAKKFSTTKESKKIINNVWHFFNQKQLPNAQNILIVGTGLTMIDMVLSLKNRGFTGKIIVCSDKVRLPLPHSVSRTKAIKTLEITDAKLPLSYILKKLRIAAKKSEDWQAVVHGLRGITQQFWQELTLEKKRRFIRHCLSMWSIHRHRVPKSNADLIEQMIKENYLNIIKGRVEAVEENGDQVFVCLNNKEIIKVDLILNAMGFDFAASQSALLKGAMQEKIIEPHSTKLGFAVAQNVKNLYLTGALLTGELLEATAIPELRAIANDTALKILK